MPADARREPPSDAGHGRGRPPDGPPEEGSWAFARGLKSMFGWLPSQAAPPLPPLTSSGLRGLHESGQDDGGVHRPSASHPVLTGTNVVSVAPQLGLRAHLAGDTSRPHATQTWAATRMLANLPGATQG